MASAPYRLTNPSEKTKTKASAPVHRGLINPVGSECKLLPTSLGMAVIKGIGGGSDSSEFDTWTPAYLMCPTTVHTWLILPVVICLSQRLSHACLSISVIQRNCEWLIKTVIVYLIIESTWITVVILELIHAGVPDFCGRAVFIR